MTRVEVAKMYKVLEDCKTMKNKKGEGVIVTKGLIKAIVKNKALLKDDFDIIIDAEKNYTEFLKVFNTKRGDIVNKYCVKDDSGNPVLINSSFYKFESIEKETLCNKELEKELKEDTEKLYKIEKEYLDLQKEVSDVKIEDLVKITEDDIPEEGNSEALEVLYSLVKED